MYHKVTVVGNLGRDPEMRYTPNGTPVTNLNVAANNRYTNQAGEQVEETVWFRVSVWGKQAEACNQYLSSGRQVLVEGRLRANEHGSPRIWFTQDDEPRATFEVTAQTVKFLGSRRDSNGPSDEDIPPEAAGYEPGEGDVDEDAIPF